MIPRYRRGFVLMGLLVLTACQYSLGPRQPSPGVADPATALEFTEFVGTSGYAIAVPVSGAIEESDTGVVVEHSDTSIIEGSLVMELEIIPTPEASSARHLLANLTGDAVAASPVERVRDTSLDAAMRSYAGPPGVICSEPRLLHAAFLVGSRGYSLVVRSDAAGRCDASAIPQAEPILQSFRAPDAP